MKSNAKSILLVPAMIALIAAMTLVIRAFTANKVVLTGQVECTEVDVASKLPGRMDSIFVQEGSPVRRGQVLARLQSREIDAKVEQARAQMAAARAKWEMARHGARPEEKEQAAKGYETARHQFELAEKTWNRISSVYRDSVISTQEHDQVEFQYKAAKEQLDAAHARYQMVLKGVRSEEIQAAEALYHQAEQGLAEALAYQDETLIKSPLDGEVFKRISDPGEIVAAGYPIFTLVDPKDVWVILQVREDQMASIRKNQMMEVVIPALGPERHPFKVTQIAAMADFATWRATNQKGDFDIKTLEIHLRPQKEIAGLIPGMTARVTL
ncbi:MAG TPA: efflux RND transporter periplasmic adaptor subunit [bacterium]|nr:efflux RND transporter periplasmic adaptor subunit [bacterium]HQG45002.1 efflux RND transporter periplasmic adaptor subunit [bacterium]HQI48485.1 efflux RND transporter periplasmic adaptor subunit [bacterium]HQJ64936.1 efflux RND transporter periplasmic adaptor subunit [bacterium]